jgi:hypothetical protein
MPGFSGTEATYRVSIAEKVPKGQPQEFGQSREIRAYSREEAIQKAQDELGQHSQGYDFKADPVKGTARTVTPTEIERIQKGEVLTGPERAREEAKSRAARAARERADRQEADRRCFWVRSRCAPRAHWPGRRRPIRLSKNGAGYSETAKAIALPPPAPRRPTPRRRRLERSCRRRRRSSRSRAVRPAWPAVRGPRAPEGEPEAGFTARAKVKATGEAGALKAARAKLGRDADKYEIEVKAVEKKGAKKVSEAAPAAMEPKPSAPLRAEARKRRRRHPHPSVARRR